MAHRKIITSVAAGVFALAAAYGGGISVATADEDVKIGAVLPFTGGAASYGQWMREGMDIAIDEINAEWKGKRRLEAYDPDGIEEQVFDGRQSTGSTSHRGQERCR